MSPEGLWFYTAAVSLLLGDLVVNPYYVGPRDSLAFAIPGAIAIWFIVPAIPQSDLAEAALWFCLGVGAVALISMLLQSPSPSDSSRISVWLREFLQTIGHPKVVLSLVFALALIEFHLQDPAETLLVGGAWAVLVGVQPERPLYWGWQRLWFSKSLATDLGSVVAYQTPGIMLVRNEALESVEFGTPLVCRDANGPPHLVVALDYVGRDDGLLLRCLEVGERGEGESELKDLSKHLGPDRVGRTTGDQLLKLPTAGKRIEDYRETLIGIVDQNTDVERLYFEIVREADIEEGHLVEADIRGKRVIYQIVNGLTKEEVVHRKHAYGYARADATKVGVWDASSYRFVSSKWLPNLNSPVLRPPPATTPPQLNTVGQFPGSKYPIGIRNVGDLVTHNTAILGILGIGKSMLAIELVERMLAGGIKVVCLDLTNQYAAELAPWLNAEAEHASTERVIAAGNEDRDHFADNPEDGGSFPHLKHALAVELRDFMRAGDLHLKIINPARFGATRQDIEPKTYRDESGAWQRTAPLWTVTSVQVTQVVAETLLHLVQDMMTDEARICLVLEEAHSLVPEFSNITNDGDRNATNGTARAILQGRKYGFGCVLVTQRTANVTKTILNQCNTVFAMRTFDDTGRAFLANYLGSRYADVLPSLGAREAVFFGKASTCENPVRVRLNDRDEFLDRFREANVPPFPTLTAEERADGTTVSETGHA
jgi:hypothetical protein